MPAGYEKLRDALIRQGKSDAEAKQLAAAIWNKHHKDNPVTNKPHEMSVEFGAMPAKFGGKIDYGTQEEVYEIARRLKLILTGGKRPGIGAAGAPLRDPAALIASQERTPLSEPLVRHPVSPNANPNATVPSGNPNAPEGPNSADLAELLDALKRRKLTR
jgi:hypothetical protein